MIYHPTLTMDTCDSQQGLVIVNTYILIFRYEINGQHNDLDIWKPGEHPHTRTFYDDVMIITYKNGVLFHV